MDELGNRRFWKRLTEITVARFLEVCQDDDEFARVAMEEFAIQYVTDEEQLKVEHLSDEQLHQIVTTIVISEPLVVAAYLNLVIKALTSIDQE